MEKKVYKQNPTIVIKKTTKKQLDDHKLVDVETYDSVIVRLMEKIKKIFNGKEK